MYKSGIDMRVLINGRPIREYTHQGMQFIESRHGSNYTIRIKNDNAFKVMAVVSVDGLDVITGKPAEKTNKGYIVDAYSSTEIKGYRLSDTDSAAFVFVSKDKSYVANSAQGDKRNSGVIGIRVFEEKPEKMKVIEKHIHHNYPVNPWTPYTYTTTANYWGPTASYSLGYQGITVQTGTRGSVGVGITNPNATLSYTTGVNSQYTSGTTSCTGINLANMVTNHYVPINAAACSTNDFDKAIAVDSFDTGTGWGGKQVDKVKKEYFRKGKLMGELVLYYASTEALTAMGVDLSATPIIAEVKKKLPKAFGDSEYCQPPKNWKG